MQIHDMLARGGLDYFSVSQLKTIIEDLEASLKKDQDAQKGSSTGEKHKKVSKSGMLAITVLTRLTMVLKLMYENTSQELPPQCAASNYRLVMTRWKDRPKRTPRCGPCPSL